MVPCGLIPKRPRFPSLKNPKPKSPNPKPYTPYISPITLLKVPSSDGGTLAGSVLGTFSLPLGSVGTECRSTFRGNVQPRSAHFGLSLCLIKWARCDSAVRFVSFITLNPEPLTLKNYALKPKTFELFA